MLIEAIDESKEFVSSTPVLLSEYNESDFVLDDIINDDYNEATISLLPAMPDFSVVLDQKDRSCCVDETAVAILSRIYNEHQLNPMFLYNLREEQDSDNGTTVRYMLALIYKYGIATFKTYTLDKIFNNFKGINTALLNPEIITDANKHRIVCYGKVHSHNTAKKVLMLNRSSNSILYQKVGGLFMVFRVFNGSDRPWDPALGNEFGHDAYHCVCIVDYNENTNQFLIQNSWGKHWGNQGFCFLEGDALEWSNVVLECWFATSSQEFKLAWQQARYKKYPRLGYTNNNNGYLNENSDWLNKVDTSRINSVIEESKAKKVSSRVLPLEHIKSVTHAWNHMIYHFPLKQKS